MTTAHEYQKVHQLDQMAANCGFKIQWEGLGGQYQLYLAPAADNLPIYTRDAMLAAGSVDYLTAWLSGWHKSREYLSMLTLAEPHKIAKAEDGYRKRVIAAKEYYERKRVLKALKAD